MSPDSLTPSRQRRAWRAMSAGGCLLAAVSLFMTAVLWRGQSAATERSVCAIVLYAERQATNARNGDPTARPPRAPNPQAAAELDRLAEQMRMTGIDCPPRARPPRLP